MNNQMSSAKGTGFESRPGSCNEDFNRDILTRFMRESARYLQLDTVAIEGNHIPRKAHAH